MIHIQRAGDEITAVLIDDIELDIHDASEDCIWAEARMDQLQHEPAASFPSGLYLEIHSEDGFGTGLFHSLRLSRDSEGLYVAFECHTPNKFWEGTWGLSKFLATVHDRVRALLARETRPFLTSFPIIIRASLRPAAKTRQSLGATEPVLQHGSRSRMTPALVAPARGRR